MSKGSRIVTFRIPAELETEVIAAMERANRHRNDEPYILSTYILACIREKLSHNRRGDKAYARKPVSQPVGPFGEEPDPFRPTEAETLTPEPSTDMNAIEMFDKGSNVWKGD